METFSRDRVTINICKDKDELTHRLADRFVSVAQDCVKNNGPFSVALSGGSTPKAFYALLAEPEYCDQVPWDATHLFWGDERCVPHDSPESNYKMAYDALIAKVPIPAENVHPTHGQDQNPAAAAQEYEKEIVAFFKLGAGKFPAFDFNLLGMGPDGHTASLFPGSAALEERSRIVVANFVAKFNTYRITLTLPAINNSKTVIFMVAGDDKKEMLKTVLQPDPRILPSQLIAPAGRLDWYVDQAAASGLDMRLFAPVSSGV